MAEDPTSGVQVKVIDEAGAPDLADFMRSPAVQDLMVERADLLCLVRAKSYGGRACLSTDGRGSRWVRLAADLGLDRSELVFLLCHELAHHAAGLRELHSDRWRQACADLVREAGQLGLLSDRRVRQGVDMAVNGRATTFRGWPERARQYEADRKRLLTAAKDNLLRMGVKPGVEITFGYRRRTYRGEVIRVNRRTVSVGEPGGDRTLFRVPFERVIAVAQQT